MWVCLIDLFFYYSKQIFNLGDTPCFNMSVESHENTRFVNVCVTGV